MSTSYFNEKLNCYAKNTWNFIISLFLNIYFDDVKNNYKQYILLLMKKNLCQTYSELSKLERSNYRKIHLSKDRIIEKRLLVNHYK